MFRSLAHVDIVRWRYPSDKRETVAESAKPVNVLPNRSCASVEMAPVAPWNWEGASAKEAKVLHTCLAFRQHRFYDQTDNPQRRTAQDDPEIIACRGSGGRQGHAD